MDLLSESRGASGVKELRTVVQAHLNIVLGRIGLKISTKRRLNTFHVFGIEDILDDICIFERFVQNFIENLAENLALGFNIKTNRRFV